MRSMTPDYVQWIQQVAAIVASLDTPCAGLPKSELMDRLVLINALEQQLASFKTELANKILYPHGAA